MNKMSGVLNDDYNESITENGAVGYRTTGKNLLDLNFAVSSLRNATPDDIRRRFERAFAEDNLYGLKWLMMCRDAREGLGEKRTPRIIFRYLAEVEPTQHHEEWGGDDEYQRHRGIERIEIDEGENKLGDDSHQ